MTGWVIAVVDPRPEGLDAYYRGRQDETGVPLWTRILRDTEGVAHYFGTTTEPTVFGTELAARRVLHDLVELHDVRDAAVIAVADTPLGAAT